MSISKRFRTEYVEILNRHSQSLSPGLVNFYNRLTYSLTFSDKKSQPDHHSDYDAQNTVGPRAYACYMGSSVRTELPSFLPS